MFGMNSADTELALFILICFLPGIISEIGDAIVRIIRATKETETMRIKETVYIERDDDDESSEEEEYPQ